MFSYNMCDFTLFMNFQFVCLLCYFACFLFFLFFVFYLFSFIFVLIYSHIFDIINAI